MHGNYKFPVANNPVFGGGASFGGKASFITAAPVTSMFNQSKNQSSGFAAYTFIYFFYCLLYLLHLPFIIITFG